MKRIIVTGANGFIGKNLVVRLSATPGLDVVGITASTPRPELHAELQRCDIIFHLAGANRPTDPAEFQRTNCDFTAEICSVLRASNRAPKIIFASSTQADLGNPYGASKRQAEQILLTFAAESGACVRIYRLTNVFGKWARPNYNSVVATFCHNIANDLPVEVSDPTRMVSLAYVDDVVVSFVEEVSRIDCGFAGLVEAEHIPAHSLLLGELAGAIQSYREMADTLLVPDFGHAFNRNLYATYLSYLPEQARETQLNVKRDNRGALAEFLKSTSAGQLFISRTLPGVTRGNHYHHTKTEKFFVVEGEGLVRMRQIFSTEVTEYRVSGTDFRVIDIPPGYTHSIKNIGQVDLITLFWANELFDADNPDTIYLPVDIELSVPEQRAK